MKIIFRIFLVSLLIDYGFILFDTYIGPEYCGSMLILPLIILARFLVFLSILIFILCFIYRIILRIKNK